MSDKTQLEQIAALLTARYPSLYILGNYDFETAQQILGICQPQWIPVAERLPEYQAQIGGERVAYVFVSVNGLTGCAEYNEGKFQFMSVPDAPVTHWMPLPEGAA